MFSTHAGRVQEGQVRGLAAGLGHNRNGGRWGVAVARGWLARPLVWAHRDVRRRLVGPLGPLPPALPTIATGEHQQRGDNEADQHHTDQHRRDPSPAALVFDEHRAAHRNRWANPGGIALRWRHVTRRLSGPSWWRAVWRVPESRWRRLRRAIGRRVSRWVSRRCGSVWRGWWSVTRWLATIAGRRGPRCWLTRWARCGRGTGGPAPGGPRARGVRRRRVRCACTRGHWPCGGARGDHGRLRWVRG